MPSFNTELLREKFTITNAGTKLEVMSNRLHCPFYDANGKLVEDLVIRGKNLYSCIRYMAKLLEKFDTGGSLLNRKDAFNWKELWQSCQSKYEETYNDGTWIIIYHQGKAIFRDGEYHPFLDMIEQCTPLGNETQESYDDAVHNAEQTFRKLGKTFTIDHDRNIAVTVNIDKNTIRCGNTIRKKGKAQAYTMSCTLNSDKENPPIREFMPFLFACAALSEAKQLAFTLGRLLSKAEKGQIKKGSSEETYLKDSQKRISQLQAEITNLGMTHKVRYRPERPEIDLMIEDAKAIFR